MFEERPRTKLGDSLRLQFRQRSLRCEVLGPHPENGNYALRWFMIPSEEPPPSHERPRECLAIAELWDEVQEEAKAHGIHHALIGSGYVEGTKYYCLDVVFPPTELMAAYQFQLEFGRQPGRGR